MIFTTPEIGNTWLERSAQPSRWLLCGIATGLMSLVWIIYAQARGFEFVNFDDRLYVVDNPYVSGLSFENIKWAFTSTAEGNWHPLTWMSLMFDVQLFDRKPGPMHVTNVVLHTLNVLVLFGVLQSLTGTVWCSAFAAALFAVHPLHVESVAWISERKDVLSTFFGFLAIWTYVRYARKQSRKWYVATLIFLTGSLLSKQMFVTLPLVFLLLDYWPLERFGTSPAREKWRRLASEKMPMLALVVVFCASALIAQHKGGAVRTLEDFPPSVRVENALLAYVLYLNKMFWPQNLAVFYPHPGNSISHAHSAAAAGLLAAVTTLAVRERQRHPYVIVGWLWYLGTLVPVIGLVQIGRQQIADRYTYLPLVGIFIAITWWLPTVLPASKRKKMPGSAFHDLIREPAVTRSLTAELAQGFLSVLATGIIVTLVVLAWNQTGTWHDSIRLWERAIGTRPNSFAETNLASTLLERGRPADASRHFHRALEIDPQDILALNSVGRMVESQGRLGEALDYFERAREINPRDQANRNNLARVLFLLKRFDEAIGQYSKAVAIDPLDVPTRANFGQVLLALRRPAEALEQFQNAVRVDGKSAPARYGLGVALHQLGRRDEAAANYREAIRLDSKSAPAHANLAILLREQGHFAEAAQHLEAAIRLKPELKAAVDQIRELKEK